MSKNNPFSDAVKVYDQSDLFNMIFDLRMEVQELRSRVNPANSGMGTVAPPGIYLKNDEGRRLTYINLPDETGYEAGWTFHEIRNKLDEIKSFPEGVKWEHGSLIVNSWKPYICFTSYGWKVEDREIINPEILDTLNKGLFELLGETPLLIADEGLSFNALREMKKVKEYIEEKATSIFKRLSVSTLNGIDFRIYDSLIRGCVNFYYNRETGLPELKLVINNRSFVLVKTNKEGAVNKPSIHLVINGRETELEKARLTCTEAKTYYVLDKYLCESITKEAVDELSRLMDFGRAATNIEELDCSEYLSSDYEKYHVSLLLTVPNTTITTRINVNGCFRIEGPYTHVKANWGELISRDINVDDPYFWDVNKGVASINKDKVEEVVVKVLKHHLNVPKGSRLILGKQYFVQVPTHAESGWQDPIEVSVVIPDEPDKLKMFAELINRAVSPAGMKIHEICEDELILTYSTEIHEYFKTSKIPGLHEEIHQLGLILENKLTRKEVTPYGQ